VPGALLGDAEPPRLSAARSVSPLDTPASRAGDRSYDRRRVRAVVVIPAGPDDDIFDTVESVLTYAARPRAVIVVDDTGSPQTPPRLRALDRDVHVVAAPAGAEGGRGGLLLKIGAGYRYARSHFDFDVLIRLDGDALFLAAGVEEAAIRRFAENPHTGLLGSHRIASDGTPRDFSPAADLLGRELRGAWRRHPHLWLTLARYVRRARRYGYERGEHCLGGAYVHSAAAVAELVDGGHLARRELRVSDLGEDHLMALLTIANGLHLGDFATGDQPLALRWRGLPDSPERLLASGKAIVHSVRSWQEMNEREVRGVFAAARRERAGSPG
jgi:hypothetical protein